MFVPETYAGAFVMMFITMVCWGTWANLQKVAKWRFELFYWDYAIGVVLLTLGLGLTLGSMGDVGAGFVTNLGQAEAIRLVYAGVSGVIFNVANFLLVAAIAIAGMAVAFPIGIGIALVIGTFVSYAVSPSGHLSYIAAGVVFILAAIVLDALAYKRVPGSRGANVKRGLALSVGCGILMGLFYPLLAAAQEGPLALGPYAAVFVFSLGLMLSTAVLLPIAMRKPITGEEPVSLSEYGKGAPVIHLAGIAGGAIWAVGTTFNVVAAANAGPAVAYAFGQGATLVAAVMGVFVWKEFKGAKNVRGLLSYMFVCYLVGLFLIGVAPKL